MDPALLKAQNLGSSQGVRDQQRRELLHALFGHADRPAGDAYRGDDLSVMVADRRADAADSFFILDVVEDAEVHGLAGRTGEIIEDRMDDPVDLQALDDLRGDLDAARGQRVSS